MSYETGETCAECAEVAHGVTCYYCGATGVAMDCEHADQWPQIAAPGGAGGSEPTCWDCDEAVMIILDEVRELLAGGGAWASDGEIIAGCAAIGEMDWDAAVQQIGAVWLRSLIRVARRDLSRDG